jgi:hypothetical protein
MCFENESRIYIQGYMSSYVEGGAGAALAEEGVLHFDGD